MLSAQTISTVAPIRTCASTLLRTQSRALSITAKRFFEQESQSKIQALNPTVESVSDKKVGDSFKTFAQYRLKVVQNDPLSLQTRRTFTYHTSTPVANDLSEIETSSQKFKELAKRISYRQTSVKIEDL